MKLYEYYTTYKTDKSVTLRLVYSEGKIEQDPIYKTSKRE